MMQVSTSMNPLEAYHALMRFAQQLGEGALRLALHAAVPQSFRPDLLHLLRLNFVPEAASNPAIESDVLLAPFCEDLGGGYFQFDAEVRRLLLDELVSTYASETKTRVQRVANFLLVYIERLSRTFREQQDRVARDYLEIQRWVALAFLAPDAAAEQLAAALAQATDRQDSVVRVQLGGLVAGLSIPLVKYPQLLTYAAGMQAFEAGQVEQGRDLLERLPDEDMTVGGVKVRSPGKVLRAWRAKDLAANQVQSGAGPQFETATGKLRKLKIFLCHSASDKPAVRDLYKRLQRDGFEPWFDEEDLLPGQDWMQEIPKAIRAADVIIVCLSQDSVDKPGYVQMEIKYALDMAEEKLEETIFLIPLKLEECEIPERLRRWHGVSLFAEQGYRQLLRSLYIRADDLGEVVTPGSTAPQSEPQTKQDIDFHLSGHVFICYAREDGQFALALARKLKERGAPVWLDQLDIRAGESWTRAIDNALYECAMFLIVLSPSAVESQEIQSELRTALDEGKPIIPIIYRPCQIPRQLRSIQYLDFSSSRIDDEEKLMRLLEVLGRGRSRVQPTFRNRIGMELILIPAGEFLMGAESKHADYDERPVRRVHITRPFYVGKYPVTQAQWQTVMGNNPSHFTGDLNRPVESVSWEEAQEFLRKLSEREKGKPYRLPTEAEWEYAARAGSTAAYCFGDDVKLLREYAWYGENSGDSTHPVGQLKPNAWGLYDVHGNVLEWVQDWYAGNYYQRRPNPDRDPQGPEKEQYRLVRGGSWRSSPLFARASNRLGYEPGPRRVDLGFRCAQ